MTKIKNKNFEPIIESALESEGFDAKHKIIDVKVGYDEKVILEKVDRIIEKIKNKEIKHLIFIGLLNHSAISSNYFDELEKNIPEDYFVISASVPSERENFMFLDSFFNSSLIYKIIAHIKERVDLEKFPISLYITTCNLHTISHLFNLRQLGVKNIYIPNCTANFLTPGMLDFLKGKFGFKKISNNAKLDLSEL